MPARQYFYTPIYIENHNIGAQDAQGNWITSEAFCQGTEQHPNSENMLGVSGNGIICLRVDVVTGRCVVSVPLETTQFETVSGSLTMPGLSDWTMVERGAIESEYYNPDPASGDNERQIDFTVEEGN